MNLNRLITVLVLLLVACGGSDTDGKTSNTNVPTFVVTTLADSGPGSLRELVATVPAKSIIGFKENLGEKITLTSDPIIIDRELTIQGTPNQPFRIDGDGKRRVFDIAAGGRATMRYLTVEHGKADNGGGILVAPDGFLYLSNSTIRDNQATMNGGGIFLDNRSSLATFQSTISNNRAINGGGLYGSQGTLTFIDSSTFSNNSAGGSDYTYDRFKDGKGGAISMLSELFLINSTLAQNSSDSQLGGGGLYVNDPISFLLIEFSTITDNTTVNGGGSGVYCRQMVGLILHATIIAQNWTISGSDNPVLGRDLFLSPTLQVASFGYNLIGSPDFSTNMDWKKEGDLIGTFQDSVDVKLIPLSDNGGPTHTCGLQADSPAHDHIPIADCKSLRNRNNPIEFDQRQFVRPGTRNQDRCDSGAYEAE